MRVSRLQLGMYTREGRASTFSVFFPIIRHLTPPSSGHQSSSMPIYFRQRDLAALFPAATYNTVLLDRRGGDRYVPGYDLRGDAKLEKLAGLSREEYVNGSVEEVLSEMNELQKLERAETEMEIEFVRTLEEGLGERSQWMTPPVVERRGKVAIEDMLDNDDESVCVKMESLSPPHTHSTCFKRESPLPPINYTAGIKHLLNSTPCPYSKRPRTSVHPSTIRSQTHPYVHPNTHMMQRVKDAMALKRQQQAIINARRQQQFSQEKRLPQRHPQGLWWQRKGESCDVFGMEKDQFMAPLEAWCDVSVQSHKSLLKELEELKERVAKLEKQVEGKSEGERCFSC
ncbi:uncharacterized protein VTP21DRAFT_10957 [Calcarisporiella thermophila]|uniref:uncharacterized protein n=1 Tax=Calcarisporiella thermophila TaxID=911321 RepID=UPI0037443E10